MLARLTRPMRLVAIALTIVAVAALALWPEGGPARAQQDARYFSDTGFRIDDDAIWDYFTKRGGTRTFGLPTSRTFTFLGAPTQFFQRQVVQKVSGSIRTLNLLDEGLLPYTTINGSTFPAADPAVAAAAPLPGSADYGAALTKHLEQYAPETFEGEPVQFGSTFSSTVTLADAFPNGGGSADLLPLLNLEIWGQPTSRPARDPKNNNFVYLRFQRGIMHYDASCKCTQGLLLADALKAVITGQALPDDLAAQAADSRLFKQYDPSVHNGPTRPDELGDSDLGNAFRPSLDASPPGPLPAAAVARSPAAPPVQQSPPAQQSPSAATSTVTPTRAAQTAQANATPTATPKAGSDKKATATPAATATSAPAAVAGPPPEGDPKRLLVKLGEAGRDAKEAERKDGADGRQTWASVRYEREESYKNFRSGPVTVFSKAIIAKDLDTARQIYDAEVAQNEKFPEAKKKASQTFPFNTEGDEDVGEEAKGLSSCVGACTDADGEIHRRMVFRVENMVGVIYTFGIGDPEGNSQTFTRRFAQKMVQAWRE